MKFGKRTCLALLFAFVSIAAAAQEPRAVTHPEDLGFAPDRLDRVTKTFQGYVDDNQLPGAVVVLARAGKVAYFGANGQREM